MFSILIEYFVMLCFFIALWGLCLVATLQINYCSEILMEDILCRVKLQEGVGSFT